MPATRIEPRVLVLLLAVTGCAANRPEPPAGAAAPVSAEATLDGYAPPAPVAPSAELDQIEASLAAYEQQLALNESRLRAMGVRIAAAESAVVPTGAAEGRFASPPPSPPADAAAGDRLSDDERPKPTKDRATKKAEAKPTASAPAPEPASKAAVQSSTRARSEAAEEKADASVQTSCGELCDLAHATCDLEAKICDLAAKHTADPRYAEVCRRAGDDCTAASEACNLCSR